MMSRINKNNVQVKMNEKSKIKDDPRFGALCGCRKEMISSALHCSSGKNEIKRT